MSDATLPPPGPGRNLLLGALALRLGFVTADALRSAVQAWRVDRTRTLAEVLISRGLLTGGQSGLIERLVEECIRAHGGESDALAVLEIDLDAPTRTAAATLAGDPGAPVSPTPGVPTGRFRVVRSHARGGLGEVFLAVDDELHREVALKEMQAPFAGSRESRARFLLEAEITGQLEHPGVVPVYGLGTHADGRPYYAMRFIRGETLADAIERFHLADRLPREESERQLTLRGLLARFVQVCNAVAFAHSRGVLHRDLKPGNIMLGPYGETLVVDWGVAKVLNRPGDESVELPIRPVLANPKETVQGVVVGTPSFMPPEQAAGRLDLMGPASDVYALGATLYAILVGEPPFDDEQLTVLLERVKRHELVPPRRKNATVPAALEAVVLKAMASTPQGRYAGARELAADVERWLADEPVSAYPEPLTKRARRWARRHRMLVGGAAALLLTTLVALTAGLWLLRDEQARTARERDLAKAHLDLARKAVDDCFVLATTEPILQQERMRDARRLLLEKALPFYQGFRRDRPDDADVQADDARYLFRVAFIMHEVGKLEAALDGYEKARDAYAALHARDRAGGHAVPLAETWNNLGNVYLQKERRPDARSAYGEALALRRPRAEARPDDADAQLDVVETVNNLSVLAQLEEDYDTAAGHLGDVERIARKLVDERRDVTRSLRTLGAALHNLGNVHARRERLDDAQRAFEEAVQAQQKLVDMGGRLTRPRSELASTLASYAALLDRRNRFDDALKTFQKARRLREDLAVEYREFAEFPYELAVIDDLIGSLYMDNLKYVPALEAYQAAYTRAATLGDEPRFRRLTAQAAAHTANALRDLERPADALPRYDEAVRLLRELSGAEARELEARAHAGRADALTRLKRHADAVRDWERACALEPNNTPYRVLRAMARGRAGDAAGAAAEAEALSKAWKGDKFAAYELACAWALASAAAKGDAAERYATRAMEFLGRAKALGLFADADHRANLMKDADLTVLRGRADFKALVEDKNEADRHGVGGGPTV